MKTTVIHHSADMDGIFCREIARKFLPDAELIGWDFTDKPLAIPEGQIYVLDLPVDKVFGINLAPGKPPIDFTLASYNSLKNRVIWIDHHASSIASHPTNIPGYRIDGVAACRLVWQWFNRQPRKPDPGQGQTLASLPTKQEFLDRKVTEPLAVRLAGEYDVWTCGLDGNLLPDLQEFQHGLRSRKLEASDWSNMLSIERPTIEQVERLIAVGHQNIIEPDGTCAPAVVCGLLQNGRLIQGYANGVDAGTMKKSFLVEWEGLKFLALNTARCNSLTFASRDVPETGHDALMGFFYNGEKWTVSLYHAKHRTDLDLSTIAVKHGGGGHRGACGYTTTKPPFI